ncbi:hypothetical protein DDV96_13280 [Marixanthomonas spongiae]|uniref:DUF4136 domain-containing protein n=2 Tax=Marixanthomonas spongiae TaxID=2174845 RepID=A0A2U0HWU4_9FLAO|nr:hypothetical protein DDV96_13280 [Marixanthomonas spongiae]
MDVQHNESFDLTSYKTYNFYPTIAANLPEDETKLIMQAVALQLFKKGYDKSDTPDFYVNFFVEEYVSYIPDLSETKSGDAKNNQGAANQKNKKGTYGEQQKEKTILQNMRLKTIAIDQALYLDVVDVKNDQLAWSAIIEGTIEAPVTEERIFQYYSERIEKAFKKFQKSAIDK